MNKISRGRGLAASDRNVLTMTRPLSRSRPEPMKPGVVECVCCLRQMGGPGAEPVEEPAGRTLSLGGVGCPCPGPSWPGGADDRACGGDRRRRPDRADVGGRAGVGGDRRRHRRTTRQSGSRRLASRGSALPHHRGARSAWRRGTIPLGGAGPSIRGLRRDLPGHQRLPHPPQLHPWRSGRATSSASWPAGSRSSGFRSFAAARWWASRRTTPASMSSCPATRRSGRSTSSGATEDAA